MGKLKITEQDIGLCQSRGMSILEIAEEYGVTAYYVLRKIQKIAVREHRGKYQGDESGNGILGGSLFKRGLPAFDLRVGDIISAIEPEITPARKRYRITEIYRHIYIGERLSGGSRRNGTWKTAFQKKDYRRAHDPNLVKLVERGGIKV